MNILVFPPVHGFGLGTLFHSTQRALPSQSIWQITNRAEIPQNKFDFAHFYTLPDVFTTFQNLLAAQGAGLRVIATAIYWNPTRYITQGLAHAELPDAGAAAERSAQIRAAQLAVERVLLRVIYHACDMLIALSPSEADALVTDFGIARERIVIAWCGVEPRYANASPKIFQEKFGLENFVLGVGRVDANKNQLNLIRALRDENIPLVLAGGSLAPSYLDECKKIAGANIHFLPSLSDEELGSAYAAARTHALVSWLEVVGLVTLEAAVAGCNVVLTREHGARDYVGDAGWYCDPGDVPSIRRAVLDAHHAPPQNMLREHLLKTYSWERHAREICDAYERALALSPRVESADMRANLEQAVLALVQLAPLLETSRAELWREKNELARERDAYANGRMMRLLNAANQILKR